MFPPLGKMVGFHGEKRRNHPFGDKAFFIPVKGIWFFDCQVEYRDRHEKARCFHWKERDKKHAWNGLRDKSRLREIDNEFPVFLVEKTKKLMPALEI